MTNQTLIGPFSQVVTMDGLPERGPIKDDQLTLLEHAGILVQDGRIVSIEPFEKLAKGFLGVVHELHGKHTALPGLVDAHTHICFGGNRARDYAMRNAGMTYLEIAKAGGGIWDTVTQTRKASADTLVAHTQKWAKRHLKNGTTTLEVKSGYGLSVEEELKMLKAIKKANEGNPVDLIPTCLAAHMHPKDHKESPEKYLSEISETLFPILKKEGLTNRIDAFVEESAFSPAQIRPYFQKARELGFDITVHADQFTTGGSAIALEINAISADHLEASTDKEIALLANSNTIATALPGASMGLGCAYTPARKIMDAGGRVAIASDHNPGSAPMGDLLTQAAILGAYEKLTNAEVLAGITLRASQALNLHDRGQLIPKSLADIAVFHTDNYQDITYYQGNLKPCTIFKRGEVVYNKH
ncbi:MAG: imidazolonepropionase [Flavobacteriaceae bacterium]